MASFNKVIMMGNLTKSPELKYLPSGTPIATFGIASSRKFKQGSELKEEVCFVDIVAFGKLAENCAAHLSKGSGAMVEGRLQQQRWENESGEKRSKHCIVADSVIFTSKKQDRGSDLQDVLTEGLDDPSSQ